jgi:DNA-binding XRE family transcriptional regulator
VSQQSSRVFFVRGFGCALFILWGNLQMSFSENFKEARKNSGLTQQQLADMLEMDRSSVSKYENGIGLPLANTLQKICEILGVTMDSLFK